MGEDVDIPVIPEITPQDAVEVGAIAAGSIIGIEKSGGISDWEKIQVIASRLNISPEPKERARSIANWSVSDLKSIASVLHSVLAPESAVEESRNAINITSPDGSNARKLAEPDEREDIFEHAVEMVQRLYVNMSDSDEPSYLKRASNVLALSIVLAHPFEDGNGRTARTLAHIVREGYSTDSDFQDDLKVLSANRPENGFRIFSYLPKDDWKTKSPYEILDAAASLDIPIANTTEYEARVSSVFTKPYNDSIQQ